MSILNASIVYMFIIRDKNLDYDEENLHGICLAFLYDDVCSG